MLRHFPVEQLCYTIRMLSYNLDLHLSQEHISPQVILCFSFPCSAALLYNSKAFYYLALRPYLVHKVLQDYFAHRHNFVQQLCYTIQRPFIILGYPITFFIKYAQIVFSFGIILCSSFAKPLKGFLIVLTPPSPFA